MNNKIVGKKFTLDLGCQSPIKVKVKEITNDKVIVEYLNAAPGRTAEFSIDEFEYLAMVTIK